MTVNDLRPSAQYFPPMKPPESLPGHVATKPKVQIVPDCDTRLRTARSLRRQSTKPPSSTHDGLRLTYGWPLYLLVAGAACLSAIGLVRGLTLLMPKHSPSTAVEPTPTAPSPASPGPFSTAQSAPDAHRVERGAPTADRNPSAQGATQPRKGEQPPVADAGMHKLVAPAPGVTATVPVTDVTVF